MGRKKASLIIHHHCRLTNLVLVSEIENSSDVYKQQSLVSFLGNYGFQQMLQIGSKPILPLVNVVRR